MTSTPATTAPEAPRRSKSKLHHNRPVIWRLHRVWLTQLSISVARVEVGPAARVIAAQNAQERSDILFENVLGRSPAIKAQATWAAIARTP